MFPEIKLALVDAAFAHAVQGDHDSFTKVEASWLVYERQAIPWSHNLVYLKRIEICLVILGKCASVDEGALDFLLGRIAEYQNRLKLDRVSLLTYIKDIESLCLGCGQPTRRLEKGYLCAKCDVIAANNRRGVVFVAGKSQ